jgi:hypothetical protein
MLKIKDNVDLKELEKFEFENVYEGYIYTPKVDIDINEIWIDGNTRKIYIVDYASDVEYIVDENLDKLFDLIQAGLVEKVSEEDYAKN